MTDLYRKELEDFRDYRGTFLTNLAGKRVLGDLVDKFCYNTIQLPASDMDLAKLDGSRDVIRYILDKLGVCDGRTFAGALAMVNVKGPEPYEQTEAETD